MTPSDIAVTMVKIKQRLVVRDDFNKEIKALTKKRDEVSAEIVELRRTVAQEVVKFDSDLGWEISNQCQRE